MTDAPDTPEAEEAMSFDEMMDAMGQENPEAAPDEPLEEAPEESTPEPTKKARAPKKAERASGLIITDDLPESTRREMEAGRAALAAKLGS